MGLTRALEPQRLARALARINRARRSTSGAEAERVSQLAGALEDILAAREEDGGADRATRGASARSWEGAEAWRALEARLSAEEAPEAADALRDFLEPILVRLIEGLLDFPERRMAVYGSLRPGEENHGQVATLVGEWVDGLVRGDLYDRGWAAGAGYPGLVWRPDGREVAVRVLRSAALPAHWARLDAFEGPGYRRILVPVEIGAGVEVCNIWELSEPPADDADLTRRS